jgi:hypothetical protein
MGKEGHNRRYELEIFFFFFCGGGGGDGTNKQDVQRAISGE